MPKTPPAPTPTTTPEVPTPTPVDPGAVPVPQPDGTAVSPQVGHPEGVEPGTSGALAETPGAHTPTMAPTLPLAADLHVDNSTEDDPSHLATAEGQLAHLFDYLRANHHGDLTATEGAGEIAVRLLTRYAAHGTTTTRCTEPYCNRPQAHTGEHGWVHVER